jgi:hypothetical protein
MTAPTIFCNECGASNPLQATYCFACTSALQPLTPTHLLQVEAIFITISHQLSFAMSSLRISCGQPTTTCT